MYSSGRDVPSANVRKIGEVFFVAFIALAASVISSERLLGIGADYYVYIDLFVHRGFVRESVEPAFCLLRYINDNLFGGHVAFIFFVSSLTALCLKIYAFRTLSSHPYVILCFYLLSFYFIHEYTQIRAAVAIGIFLCSIKDINRNNSNRYFCKSLIAILFHYSAVIMIICWIYVRIATTKKRCVMITATGILFSVFFTDSTRTFIEYVYLIQNAVGLNKSGIESDFMSTWHMKYLALLSLFFYLSFLVKKEDVQHFTLYQIFSFGLCCYYYLLPIHLPVITVRLAEFYTVVFIILLVNIAYDKKYCTLKKRHILLFAALTLSILYGYAAMKTINIL